MFIKKRLYPIIISILLLIFLFIILFNLFYSKREPFNDKPKKIAFCFMIYDSINHEELWNKFFANADKNKYTIYIHYKENLPLKYFEDNKIKNCIPTAWGDKSLIKASNLLFKTAFEDDDANYKFVLLSNSCIPLKSFDYVYDFLTKDNMGYVNEGTVFDRFKESKMYKKNPNFFGKSSQWVILNREMVQKIAFVDDTTIDEELSDMLAPDEIYYLTYIKRNHMEDQLIKTQNLSSGATTFTYWQDMESYPFPKTNANPYAYDTIDQQEIDYLLAEPCLFGRKFNQNCNVKMNNNEIVSLYDYYTYFM